MPGILNIGKATSQFNSIDKSVKCLTINIIMVPDWRMGSMHWPALWSLKKVNFMFPKSCLLLLMKWWYCPESSLSLNFHYQILFFSQTAKRRKDAISLLLLNCVQYRDLEGFLLGILSSIQPLILMWIGKKKKQNPAFLMFQRPLRLYVMWLQHVYAVAILVIVTLSHTGSII